MPNSTPQEWTDRSTADAPSAMPGPWPGGSCANGACTIPEVRENGVYIASNIPGSPAGGFAGTHEEWAAFIDQVKAGAWDHTVVTAGVPIHA